MFCSLRCVEVALSYKKNLFSNFLETTEKIWLMCRVLDEAFIEQQTYAWISLNEVFQRSTEEQVQGAGSSGK